MNEFIRRRVARQPQTIAGQSGVAAVCLGVAVLSRLALTPLLGASVPYVTSFPMLLVATLLGGARAGLLFLISAPLAVMTLAIPPFGRLALTPADLTGALAFFAAGGAIVWLSHHLSRTLRDLDAANVQEHLLVLELHHRVKNMLAVVQSLAAQTFTATGGGPAFRAAFTERLIALGRAQNVLSEAADASIPLGDLVRRTVAPFLGGRDERLSIMGDDIRLRADAVIDLALCLHELGTNATKHGALSGRDGRIDVSWRHLTPSRLEFVWAESGGPPVAAPSARGFGSRLLSRGLSGKVHPHVTTEFRREGLVWTLQFDTAD